MGDGDYTLTTSSRPQTGWNQEVNDGDSQNITLLPYHQPNRTKLLSWSHTLQPSPLMLPLKTIPESHQEVRIFWAWVACSPCLASWNIRCTTLHQNSGSVDGFVRSRVTTVVISARTPLHTTPRGPRVLRDHPVLVSPPSFMVSKECHFQLQAQIYVHLWSRDLLTLSWGLGSCASVSTEAAHPCRRSTRAVVPDGGLWQGSEPWFPPTSPLAHSAPTIPAFFPPLEYFSSGYHWSFFPQEWSCPRSWSDQLLIII